MKRICIFLGICSLPLSLGAAGVGQLIVDAEQFEQRGETDSAITVLKNAEHSSPENTEVGKLLARQYVLKVDDATDPASKKTYAEMARDLAKRVADKLPNDSEAQVYRPSCQIREGAGFDGRDRSRPSAMDKSDGTQTDLGSG
jgi:hypothetical protein